MERLYAVKPDLLFLDIQMPEVTGFSLLDMLTTNRPQVVLTTAYPHYAISGFDYAVTDYLLKPIRFERFLTAVNKVQAQVDHSRIQPAELTSVSINTALNHNSVSELIDPYIWINVNKTKVHLNTQEVLFVESLKDYVNLHMPAQTITVRSALHKIEQLLPTHQFIRINRSYLVRRDAILAVQGHMVELINKKQLPIGISYRESIREKLK